MGGAGADGRSGQDGNNVGWLIGICMGVPSMHGSTKHVAGRLTSPFLDLGLLHALSSFLYEIISTFTVSIHCCVLINSVPRDHSTLQRGSVLSIHGPTPYATK